jgi:hypothetical protein
VTGPVTANVIATTARPTVSEFTVSDPAAAESRIRISATAGQQAALILRNGTADQWRIFKETTQSLRFSHATQASGNGQFGVDINGAQGPSNLAVEVGPRPFGPYTTSVGAQTLPVATFNVTDNSAFPASGVFYVRSQPITYTGKTGTTQFTGCSGGSGSVPAGSDVTVQLNAADIYLWNKVKIWATPNTVYGNQALDLGTGLMWGYGSVGVNKNYRLGIGIAGFKDGQNGARNSVATSTTITAGSNLITTDDACGGDSDFWNPIAVTTTIRGNDLGSIQNYPSYITIDEPGYAGSTATDSYCEGYSYPTALYIYRRGVLASAGESGIHMYAPSMAGGSGTHDGRATSTHTGPARASGYSIILEEKQSARGVQRRDDLRWQLGVVVDGQRPARAVDSQQQSDRRDWAAGWDRDLDRRLLRLLAR